MRKPRTQAHTGAKMADFPRPLRFPAQIPRETAALGAFQSPLR